MDQSSFSSIGLIILRNSKAQNHKKVKLNQRAESVAVEGSGVMVHNEHKVYL